MTIIRNAKELNTGTLYEIEEETTTQLLDSDIGLPEQVDWFRKNFQGYFLVSGEVREIDTLTVEVSAVDAHGDSVDGTLEDSSVWTEKFSTSYGHVNHDEVLLNAVSNGFGVTT